MSAASATETIDLRAILRKLIAKWWLFGITITLAVAAGVAYIKTTPKIYHIQAVVLMSERGRNVFGGGNSEEFLKGSSLLSGSSDIEDQVAVLTSVNNIAKALKRLDYGITYYERKNFMTQERFEYPPFFVRLDTVAVQVHGVPIHIQVDREAGTYRVTAEADYATLYNVQKQAELEEFYKDYKIDRTVKIGEPFSDNGLSFSVDFPADRKYGQKLDHFFVINSLDGMIASYRARTFASPISDESSIVSLSTSGEVVEKERMFLNKLLETYIEGELYRRNQKGIKTINFIDGQIGIVSDSLQKVESSMEQFRGSSGGMMSATTTSDALFQERSRLEDERSLLQRRRQYCSAILDKVRSSSDMRNVPAPSSSGIDDPVLNNLVLEITKLSADLAVQNATTGARTNPAVIAMERRKRNLMSSLEQTAESLVEQAEISLVEVNRRLSRLSYEFNQLPENERALGNIERKFKLSESLYNYLMEKRAEAGIAIASDQLDKYVVDEARMSTNTPVKPDKKVVLGGALLIGLLIPMGFILIKDFFNDTVVDLDQLGRLSPIPVLATIPTSKRKRILPEEPKSLLAESFRTARINLQYLNVHSGRQVIGFTSSTSGEGKTFCAVNLATVIALSGKRTLIIDADMRRPRLAETMNVAEGQGLSTHLIGECTVDEMIRRSDVQGLDLVTAGPIPPNPLELVELERMEQLFKELRSRYDHIIVDASPMGLVSEYVILMRHVDITLYLVRQGFTKRGALRLVNEMFADKKVRSINLLLNDVKQAGGYGQGYGYYTK
ncbi:MAG: polysaccharide biosynthesis tyrosine autokinase [Bacteroidota bacterium]|nr:polysaccharide biosynthesis tyrosine autokinase [Bacteroidota bacterium]